MEGRCDINVYFDCWSIVESVFKGLFSVYVWLISLYVGKVWWLVGIFFVLVIWWFFEICYSNKVFGEFYIFFIWKKGFEYDLLL